jgi:hypothetical protein
MTDAAANIPTSLYRIDPGTTVDLAKHTRLIPVPTRRRNQHAAMPPH